MIRCFTGLPRAGKSYGALLDQKTEMIHGKRSVWHNMEIDHGELAVYCKERGYEPDFAQRMHKIPHDSVRTFWQYAKEQGHPNGRLFVIDEAHIFFDARAWAEVGKEMSVYLTQHGHMNDEILFITQHPEMLDKRIRLLIAQTTTYRNLRTERWLQWFKPPAWMVWSEYYGIPKHGQKPDAIGRRKLDPALAKCYKTSVGHGGLGASGKPEEDRPAKRLKWYWLAVPAVGLLLAITYAPELLIKMFVGGGIKALMGATEKPAAKAPAVTQSPVAQPAPAPVKPVAATEERQPAALVRAVGVLHYAGKLAIVLSDGRVITQEDNPYRKAGYVYWDGGERALWSR